MGKRAKKRAAITGSDRDLTGVKADRDKDVEIAALHRLVQQHRREAMRACAVRDTATAAADELRARSVAMFRFLQTRIVTEQGLTLVLLRHIKRGQQVMQSLAETVGGEFGEDSDSFLAAKEWLREIQELNGSMTEKFTVNDLRNELEALLVKCRDAVKAGQELEILNDGSETSTAGVDVVDGPESVADHDGTGAGSDDGNGAPDAAG